MPLDPQAQAVIDTVNSLGLPAVWEVTPEQARINAAARPRPAGPEVSAVEDRSIPAPDGDVPVRIYTPEGSGPFPILAWYHGGGWVVGDLESADATARHLCKGAGAVVVSVDYRLAPETKFPGPAEDCYAATVWAANNAASHQRRRIAIGRGWRQRRWQPGCGDIANGSRPGWSGNRPSTAGVPSYRNELRDRLLH